MLKKRSILGFQLIELLVVLAMIGILTSIGIPTYQHYFVQTHRTTAKASLLTIAVGIEKYGIEHNSYLGVTLAQLNFMRNPFYEYKILAASDASYSIIAIPLGLQAERDPTCGSLILTSSGEKKITGNGSINECF